MFIFAFLSVTMSGRFAHVGHLMRIASAIARPHSNTDTNSPPNKTIGVGEMGSAIKQANEPQLATEIAMIACRVAGGSAVCVFFDLAFDMIAAV